MKDTVTFTDFCDRFRDMGRNDSFTYAGKRALFDYLEELEDGCDMEIELDVVGLDCEYSEHDTAIEAAEECGFEPELGLLHEVEEAATDWLNERTQVIVFNGGVIIAGF